MSKAQSNQCGETHKAQIVPDSRGLDPGIHRKNILCFKQMDCRVKPVKPGNDDA